MKEEDSINKLRKILCCCGDDHTVRQGGVNVNAVQLKYLATWPYMTARNLLVPESEKYPLACAVVCDRCLKERKEIKYAVAGEPGEDSEVVYRRVPISELQEPVFYWPDHHPDNNPPRIFK